MSLKKILYNFLYFNLIKPSCHMAVSGNGMKYLDFSVKNLLGLKFEISINPNPD